MQVLTFSLNGIDFGIKLADVASIEKADRVIHIPGAPENVKGIMRLHGGIVPIYSLASKFRYGEQRIENVIVTRIAGMQIGLEVGKVKEILDAADREVIPVPPIMSATEHCFRQVISRGKELIVLISVELLFTAEERQAIRQLIEDNT